MRTHVLLAASALVLAALSAGAATRPVGKRTAGFVQSFTADHLHAGQTGVKGLARVTLDGPTQPEWGYTNPVDYVQFAHMQVRWRIGDAVPVDRWGRETWDEYFLVKTGPDTMETYGTIRIPDFECDLEFRYITVQAGPYCGYIDFTGMNLGVPGYEERPLITTNSLSRHVAGRRSTDWFQRVRGSSSATLSVRRVTP